MKKPEEILFLHFAAWVADIHLSMGSPTVQDMQETSIEKVCIPAMLEYASQVNAEAVRLLRDLHDLQNGPPLEKYREEWEETMQQVGEFLEKHEFDHMQSGSGC